MARVQLPTETNSAAGATSRTRTHSHAGSEVDPVGAGTTAFAESTVLLGADSSRETEELHNMVARLEAMQAQFRSPQQPSPEMDALLARVLAGRPEWRPRMAVMTKSALIRKRILAQGPAGGRAVGSSMLGSTHTWRQEKMAGTFTDHNWSKATAGHEPSLHSLPGGTAKHAMAAHCPADKLRMNPLISHSASYSMSKDKRFHGTQDNGELDKSQVQRREPPGPGAYFKSVPRGTPFSVDGGETVVLGANHHCPWKGCLGRQINPVTVDATTLKSSPCFSFSRTRRTLSDATMGHGPHTSQVKSDAGCLSPGMVYEQFGTMRPIAGRSQNLKRSVRSSPSLPRVRCVPVEPEGHVAL